MTIRLKNSLTKQVDELIPVQDGIVSMYHCGPTVYNYTHLGNLSAFVFSDIIRRTAEYNGYKVNQVINITDFGHIKDDADSGDDKMMIGLKRENLPISMEGLKTLTNRYTNSFVEDLKKLNVLMPTHMPKATEHIEEDIDLIKTLEDKGLTYQTPDAIYFNTEKIDDYGKLGGLPDELQTRIGDVSEKKNPRDFSLWKFSDEFGWPSPWGQGFPGWHIECSAMAMKYLGETFDIHTGGIDNKPVHHNNEIAQSEHATGKPFAHIWMHREHIQMNGARLEKSTGNTAFLKDFDAEDIHPIAFRYWLLLSHYSTNSDFSFDAMRSAQNALEAIIKTLIGLNTGSVIQIVKDEFTEKINDDLDTPAAIALLQNVISSPQYSPEDIKATIFDIDQVLGLNIQHFVEHAERQINELPEHITELLKKREGARSEQDWAFSDQIRDIIKTHGFIVKDTPEGQKVLPEKLLI